MVPTLEHRYRRRPRRAVPHRLALWLAASALLALAACSGEAPLPGDPLRLIATPLPDAVQGERYQQDLVPSGGLRPYTFTLADGAFPPGLALQGGTIIGTPEALGRFSFTVSVSDARLSTTYEEWLLTVTELPVPAFDLAVPDTEARGATVLRGGVREARALRGLRVWIEWQDPAVSLGADGVQASRDDIAVFVDARDNGVAIDLAVLGEPIDGDAELFRLTLNAAEATVLGVDTRSEFLYSGRHAFDETRIGAPRPAPAGVGDGDEEDDQDGGQEAADETAVEGVEGVEGTDAQDSDAVPGADGDDPAAEDPGDEDPPAEEPAADDPSGEEPAADDPADEDPPASDGPDDTEPQEGTP